MTRLLAILVSALVVASCAADPISTTDSRNKNVKVDVLTEFDGVRVYRFMDNGYYIYIAVSAHDIRAQWDQTAGKTHFMQQTMTVRP